MRRRANLTPTRVAVSSTLGMVSFFFPQGVTLCFEVSYLLSLVLLAPNALLELSTKIGNLECKVQLL